MYNNLILVGITFATLWGTLFPVISEAVRGVKITVGPPFFNKVNIPFGLALLFLTGLCPLVAWRKTTLKNLRNNLLWPFGLAVIGGFVIFFSGITQTYPLMSFTLALFVLLSISSEFYRSAGARKRMAGENVVKAAWSIVTRNKRRYGGYIVHVGMALIFVGITGNALKTEIQATVKKGETFEIKNYTLRYEGLSRYPTAQMDVVVAALSVFSGGEKITVLNPEKNFHRGQDQTASEVAIYTTLKEDLYAILAGWEDDVATFKVLVNPLVAWLWIGGIVMGLGTLFAMLPNYKKAESQL